MRHTRADSFGQGITATAAWQRMGEAAILLRAGEFAGTVYLAGRAVEGMLRALIWKHDLEVQRGNKSLDTGHDLRELLDAVQKLALTGNQAQDSLLEANVQHLGRLWYNNIRFASARYIETRWFAMGEVNKKALDEAGYQQILRSRRGNRETMRGLMRKQDLEEALTRRLKLKSPRFKLRRLGGKLVGNVISDTFLGKGDFKRLNMIWNALEAEFGPKAVKMFGMLLAYTDAEWDIDFFDEAAPTCAADPL